MDALCAEFFNTLPVSTKADSKKVAKKLHDHFVPRICYYGRQKTYYFEASHKNYVPLDKVTLAEELRIRGLLWGPKTAVKQLLKNAPKSKPKENTKELEKADAQRKINKCLSEARERRQVKWAGELAGHFPGLVRINNKLCLILQGPELTEPKKGDHLPIYNIVKTLLACDPEQLDYVLAYLQRARRILREGRYEPLQILIFGGTHHDGKTLFVTEILCPALGGRRADASRFLTGETHFNAELARSELWVIDDHNETRWYDKRILESVLKKIAANPDVPVEAKFMDALNAVDLFRVPALLFNLEGTGGSHLIPPLSEDFEGKVSSFRTQRAELPTGPNQFREIRKITRGRAMPAFLYWIDNEFVPRADVLSGDRYQIKAYHNPEVVAQINQYSAGEQLLPILDRWIRESGKDEWTGTAEDLLYDVAHDDKFHRVLAEKKCANSRWLGRALSEIARDHPERAKKFGVDAHRPSYRFFTEAGSKKFAMAEESASAEEPTTSVLVPAKFQP